MKLIRNLLGEKSLTPRQRSRLSVMLFLFALLCLLVIGIPLVVALQSVHPKKIEPSFPIGVDPRSKTITENREAEDFFSRESSPLQSTLASASDAFAMAAAAIASSPFYKLFPLPKVYLVQVFPGYRREEVATAFKSSFGWNDTQEKKFLESTGTLAPHISEGEFAPGVYVYNTESGNKTIRESIRNQFENEILSRFSSTTARRISLEDALKIASIIQRETSNKQQMRVISGIIWNRLFRDMNLQMDATLQYAKATKESGWWPAVYPADKYIDSPFNTYKNAGLPPAPIANPGVAAIMATLNPRKTPCLFYFHDRRGGLHCSITYANHVALIKQYYRRK